MKNNTQQSQYFNARELWFLFNKYSPAIIIGLPDPTLGFLTSDIQEINQRARNSLIAKKIIEPEHNQGWKIREPVDKWVQDIAAPAHTILVVRREGVMPESTASYHFTQGRVIGLIELEKDKYMIDPTPNPGLIVELLMRPILTKIYMERDEPPFEISSRDFEKMRTQIEKNRISQANKMAVPLMEEKKFDRLAKAISNPVTRFSVLTFLNRNQAGTQETRGFSVIAGEDDIWLFRAKSKDLLTIQITSVSKPELEDTIKRFVPAQEATL